ncbi:LacI family DNA-binding transcriptional regulator [uncultured Paracoccus sp.]|uniref:LacI family DNA-binding transcriptional regulator n=1 Tax=uncultured Paracoccus sp. TaxID=189685 RepID=UPI00260272DB|nr:LacI family DNA-binding transcriptional regulator [uncultured Paracoccus sp.]
MNGKSPSSYDVAKLAGVSRSTVSHVLNGSNAVSLSDETKDKVRKAAQILGYRPNSAAVMLKKGTTDTVGLLITETASLRVDGFIPLLHYAIAEVLRREGLSLLLETFQRREGVNPYNDLVVSRRIDGLLVLSPSASDKDLTDLIDSGFPMVLIGSIGHPKEIAVSSTIVESSLKAAAHVVGLGHRRIGCVPFSKLDFAATEGRLRDLRSALAAQGVAMEESAIVHADFSAESGHAATLALMAAHPDITAIFAGNDTIALGVIGALASLGLSVPQDVSVIGFDDLPFAASIAPPLTTVRIEAEAQGRIAAELLVRRLRGVPIEETRVLLPSEFIERGSSAPVRADGMPRGYAAEPVRPG